MKPWSVNASVVFLVRLVFVYRLWRLCKSTSRIGFVVIVGVTVTIIFSLVDLTCSITLSAQFFLIAHRKEQIAPSNLLFEMMFFSGMVADALLTVLLCMFLHGSRTGLRRTDSVINILILYAIETGLFPSIIEGAGMIAFYLRPKDYIFVAFYVQTPNLYLIALVTSQVLNARDVVRRRIESPITVNFTALESAPASASSTDLGTSTASMMQPHADEETLHTASSVAEKSLPPLELLEKEILGGTSFPEATAALDLETGTCSRYGCYSGWALTFLTPRLSFAWFMVLQFTESSAMHLISQVLRNHNYVMY
ncbi:hypothetical protein A0H81_13092 [Grifola frondosa]|uniref:DUF6534 domain-containing protein n=1 Tax=Grifola frondosa TaxID=5627 RepID=A0A1C7LPN2_GRIFR|nr:hypothetical protein A0H81_13092 [Grifola frondosa]